MAKFMGLDIGTTTISGLIYDLEDRKILHRITADHAHGFLVSEQEWERLQDAEAIYGQTLSMVEELLSRESETAGIGLTGQMHGIVYMDIKGMAVSPLYTWQDGRGGQMIPGASRTYAERLSEQFGMNLSPGYGLATHAYNTDHGLVPAEAASICSIADYIGARLTGKPVPVMDATQAAAIGGYRRELHDFDRSAIGKAGMDAALLPQVVPSGTLAGHSPQGIPVYVSLGDNQASFLGSVPRPEGTLLMNVGTGSQLSAYVPEIAEVPKGMEARPYPGGGLLLVGAALSGGKSYAMLQSFFRDVIEGFTGQTVLPKEIYAWMDQMLHSTPGCEESLRVLPFFNGTRANPELRGSIEQISLGNFTPGALTHAFLSGMVEELYEFCLSLKASTSCTFTELAGSGNALRANPVLCAKAEEIFGMKMKLSASPEEAAVGAALCAAVGSGSIESFRHTGQFLI
ncbi:sedoheptulokinase [Paenibacillus pinistramenti]|uniref:sedoheptulokinase n=1 Tax=Paenibacillus pinistramenti TaxID=1768003 RepID=UPI00139678D5|nr:FGGY family carbohydrate kinase [Paenibacillus pinistramenti]